MQCYKIKCYKILTMTIFSGLVLFLLSGCGDTEKAMSSESEAAVEDTVDKMGSMAENAGETMGSMVEDAGEAMGSMAEDAGDTMDSMAEDADEK